MLQDLPTTQRVNLDQQLVVESLGLIDYHQGQTKQQAAHQKVVSRQQPATLLLLEHPPTYTIGRNTSRQQLPLSDQDCQARGIAVALADRGGQITYHGPGQLVGYTIIPVSDVVAYLRDLEQVLIQSLQQFDLAATTRHHSQDNYTGVWVGEKKIASIGLHLQRGVTSHGFALNVNMDMSPWRAINPCGLDIEMTSIELEKGSSPSLSELGRAISINLAEQLDRSIGETI